MPLSNPAFAIQAMSHGAQLFREAVSSVLAPAGGIIQPQDFTISALGTPNMSVNVAAGRLWVPGTSLATVNPGGGAYYPQGLYFGENDATVNLSVASADPTNPRIDTIIAQIQDAFYAGTTNSAQLAVLTGTATAGANLTNLTGAAAVPVSSYVIGYVQVRAGTVSIIATDISNVASVAGLQGAGFPLVTALPSSPADGQVIHILADSTNGVVWRLRYRSASASTYKWEFIGGSQLYASVATTETQAAGALLSDLTTVGPSITLPLAGDYIVRWGFLGEAPSLAANGYMGSILTDSLNNRVSNWEADIATGGWTHCFAEDRFTVTPANTSVKMRYFNSTSVTGSFAQRHLSFQPVRVG